MFIYHFIDPEDPNSIDNYAFQASFPEFVSSVERTSQLLEDTVEVSLS